MKCSAQQSIYNFLLISMKSVAYIGASYGHCLYHNYVTVCVTNTSQSTYYFCIYLHEVLNSTVGIPLPNFPVDAVLQ